MELLYVILFVCYASYAYNRKSVPFSLPMLIEDGMDISHAGLIISCQNIAFAISKFSAGVLSDRLNPHLLFATGLLVSGFATLAFSWSSSVATFCGLWFLNGLAQGCGWPACAKIIRQRASPSQFGSLWSVLSSSNNLSGSLGPFLSAFIIVHFGWRWSVFTAGFITLLLCVAFLLSLPFVSDVPKVNTVSKKTSKEIEEKTSIYDLFLDPFVWLLSLGFMIVFCARTTTIDWGQLYLMEEKKQTQYVASAFTSSVETGGFVGRIAAGYLTDWVIRRNVGSAQQSSSLSTPMLRLSVATLFVFGSVIGIHLFQFYICESSSTVWITSIGAFMGMCYYGPIAIFGIVASESVPSHLSGSSHAIVALFGNIGATISGLPFSYVAKYYSWSTVFLVLEVLAAGTLFTLLRFRTLTPKLQKYDKEN